MNYIYNIKVNLKEYLLNYYEWNEFDDVIRISKIPIYIVSTKDYINLLNMSVKLEKECLNCLELVNNMCLFTNLFDVICVNFAKDGMIDKISKLSLIEEASVLDELKDNNKIKLKYKLINKSNNYKLIPRYENKIINELIEYIESKKEDEKVIDYLYYEWFKNKKCNNKYDSLVKSINKNYSIKHDNFYKIIELIESKNV